MSGKWAGRACNHKHASRPSSIIDSRRSAMATVHMDIDDHPHVRWLNQVQRPGLIKAPISGRVGGDGLTTSPRGPTSDQTRLGMPERATEYQWLVPWE
ncbi:BZ3500_MvSof-1268-A1-R1_Chr10-2g02956 [Microbotryum saponariae]|uniref:BZ3500_MvSof-1268-A1-R1_Chr10-2g02956 protein n=1 Tax=Microbotryum saponariae TaxID=289078 RepID=A0A2X0M9R3_9BASI|nr:BZ3501_MvSof-1269-A2-R1_Chr10-2g02542 [Microbotryum saponariae]SDA01817.1 BZ3500_MvSof-1268-A1-R1_Chr10-2g02956 [Microbotryum saponariae]